MKKIGKEVHFIKTKESNPRNGEGTFIRLKDGRIMHMYTEYYGTGWADDAIAHLCACYSSDEGENWSESSVIIEKDPHHENIMSPSLFRMADGNIGVVYGVKEKIQEDAITCMPVFRSSSDEGKSWSEPVLCINVPGYYCAINDGVCVEKSGRILVPFALHGPCVKPHSDNTGFSYGGKVLIACSYDNGKTWGMLPQSFSSPIKDHFGLAEPGVYEHENGDLWMWCRTPYGFQYESRSTDGGISWSDVIPNFCFTSPDSPMRVKKVGKYTVAIFNPLSYNCLRTDHSARGNTKRTPLVCAVSTDDGRSFDTAGRTHVGGDFLSFTNCVRIIEDDYNDSYCYPSIIEVEDGFLVAYYHSNRSPYTLNSTKITKIYFDELGD